jgi:pimeloyl-ACP methyl ester carboxylesterase
MKLRVFWLLVLMLLVLGGTGHTPGAIAATAVSTAAPGLGTPGPAQALKIRATDGLQLAATFYPSMLSGRQSPAVLLLHQINGSQAQWKPLIPELLSEGYSVLAVDMRGFGATRGQINWKLAEGDVATMLAWLRGIQSIDGKQIAIVGASMGANLAIRGCANDPQCTVAIALSPGVEYFGITTDDAIQKMRDRSVLLVAGQIDRESANGVKKLATLATGNIMARLYNSGRHGIELFAYDDLIPTMLRWLRTYIGATR